MQARRWSARRTPTAASRLSPELSRRCATGSTTAGTTAKLRRSCASRKTLTNTASTDVSGRRSSTSSTGCRSMLRRRRLLMAAVESPRVNPQRRRRLPSSVGGGSFNANVHLKAGPAAAAPPDLLNFSVMSGPDFWFDFEAASLLDLEAAGALRYATHASTRTIVLAYAIGDGPARAWHADGAILDWGHAPDDLR